MKTRSAFRKLSRSNMSRTSFPLPSPPTKLVLPMEERERTLESRIEELQWSQSHSVNSHRGALQNRPLLLLSEDEMFCWKLLMAASQLGRRLVRGHPMANAPQTLRIVKPEVVLLDLDLHEELAWVAADALLQDESCPPLILLTSNGRQSDFDTAIQAGCLIEKTIEPMRLLAVVEQKLMSTKADQREQIVVQRLVIRWLKPVQVARLNRYWGINE
jgi:CheY-like chemotaxis protein